MHGARDHYPDCPEPLLVGLARRGDRDAFAELVRRRQSPLRNLMRRFCGDPALADDLAQQVFLKMWLNLRKLRKTEAFSGWLRQVAVSVWLQHLRKKDALKEAGELVGTESTRSTNAGVAMDLDRALAQLPPRERLCVVLCYNEGMSHREIAETTDLPLGTVKSHIRNGAQRLQQILSAYLDAAPAGAPG